MAKSSQSIYQNFRRELQPFGISVHIVEPGFHKTNITSSKINCNSLTTAWKRLSPELQKEYGQQYYDTGK